MILHSSLALRLVVTFSLIHICVMGAGARQGGRDEAAPFVVELNNRGFELLREGRFDEAIALFHDAIRLDPRFAEAHINLGAAYFELGRHGEAAQALRNAVRLRPDLHKAHHNLAVIYSDSGEFRKAIESYKIALTLRPDYHPARYGLAVALLATNKRKEAIKEYARLKKDDEQLASKLLSVIDQKHVVDARRR